MGANDAKLIETEIRRLFSDGVWRAGSEQQSSEDFNPSSGAIYARVVQASDPSAARRDRRHCAV